jgi:hypothetical protein
MSARRKSALTTDAPCALRQGCVRVGEVRCVDVCGRCVKGVGACAGAWAGDDRAADCGRCFTSFAVPASAP